MAHTDYTVARRSESVLSTNRVLRNTYLLLSMTLMFSAAVAGFAMVMNLPHPGLLLTLAGVYGLMFLTQSLRNSPFGLLAVFAFTGFLGYTLGPLLNAIMSSYGNGGQIITTALGATGVIFLSLSGYVMTTKKDFSYMGGFLFVGAVTAVLAGFAAIFFQLPGLHLAVSGAFVLISSGFILYETSQIINGGERNYIMATITLYVSIYNLFVSLLHLLSAFSGRD